MLEYFEDIKWGIFKIGCPFGGGIFICVNRLNYREVILTLPMEHGLRLARGSSVCPFILSKTLVNPQGDCQSQCKSVIPDLFSW